MSIPSALSRSLTRVSLSLSAAGKAPAMVLSAHRNIALPVGGAFSTFRRTRFACWRIRDGVARCLHHEDCLSTLIEPKVRHGQDARYKNCEICQAGYYDIADCTYGLLAKSCISTSLPPPPPQVKSLRPNLQSVFPMPVLFAYILPTRHPNQKMS